MPTFFRPIGAWIIAAALTAALAAPALTQSFPGVFPSGTVYGNAGASAAGPAPVTATSWLDRWCSASRGALVTRTTSWQCTAPGTAGLPVLSGGAGADLVYGVLGVSGGGTACSAASGICLDNITGFASTGQVARTAAGTYAFRTLTGPAAGITVSNGNGVSGNPTLALANDLSALEALTGTGFAVRTTTDTWAQRSLTAPAAGITISNADGVAGNPTLALANDLAALEGLGSTGIAVRTGVDAWAQRQLANAAAGITWTNGDGVAGNPTPVLANDLAALEGLSSVGLAARTATDTWAQRSITGTANEITVTNGDGVAGNPTLSLPAALTFSGKTITGGAFSSPAIGTPAIQGLADVQGAVKLSTQTAPAQITANQNNYALSGICSTSSTWLINADAARDITGLSGGVVGCAIILVNNGAFAITLKDESASSTAANRFGFGADLALAAKNAVHLIYDNTAQRWRNLSSTVSPTAGVTSVICGAGLAGGTITTSGTCSAGSGNRVLLATLTGSGGATLTDTTHLTSTYSTYEIVLQNVVPSTGASLRLRVSTDGGANYQTSGYLNSSTGYASSNVFAADISTTYIGLSSSASTVSSNSAYGVSGTIYLYNPSSTTTVMQAMGRTSYISTSTLISLVLNGVWNSSGSAINAIEFSFSSGNINSGTIKIFGIVN